MGVDPPELTLEIVAKARTGLKTGRVTGGGDTIVAEMPLALAAIPLYCLAYIFCRRYEGIVENLLEWRHMIMAFFYPKSSDL